MPSDPAKEKERLAALRQYQILDTKSEPEYDEITRLAAEICQVPMAMIMFADQERAWIKSSLEFSLPEMPQGKAFTAHAIMFPGEPFVVSDMRSDERFKDNPLVKADSRIVFFAAIPLNNPDGYTLGCLCILDKHSRSIKDNQLKTLQILARQIIRLLEFRKLNLRFESLKSDLVKRNAELKQFAYVVSHDIKSPLASIVLSTEMLREHFGENIDDDNTQMLNILTRSSLKIRNLAEGVQAFYRSESYLNEDAETFELSPFFASISEMFMQNNGLEIPNFEEGIDIYTKKSALELIFVNLIQNAFKFSDKVNPKVQVRYSEDDSHYFFTVGDNGKGMTQEEQERIIEMFAASGPREKFGMQNSGTGLPTVKRLVERLSGRINLKSTEGVGSEFSFTIKKQI